jgi:hypothetical protein
MISAIKSLLGYFNRPKFYVEVSLDHVEISDTYLIMGLNLDWLNRMEDSLSVEEVEIRLYMGGRKAKPIKLSAHGNFTRDKATKKLITTIGAKPFILPALDSHDEGARFFTRAILDIEAGKYPIDIFSTVPAGTYINSATIQVTVGKKYRTSGSWTRDEGSDEEFV